MLTGVHTDLLFRHPDAMTEYTASVRWKASQKICLLGFRHGFDNGIHPEVPFAQVVQHGLLASVRPTKYTYDLWLVQHWYNFYYTYYKNQQTCHNVNLWLIDIVKLLYTINAQSLNF